MGPHGLPVFQPVRLTLDMLVAEGERLEGEQQVGGAGVLAWWWWGVY